MLDEYADISRKVARENDATLCDLRSAFLNISSKQSETITRRYFDL